MSEFTNNHGKTVLPWHADLRASLSLRWRASGWPAALVIEASRGSGKRLLAEHLAQDRLCGEPLASGLACGRCQQCLLLAADSHPDLFVLKPVDSRVIKVDQIRALADFAYTRPQVAQRKLAILDTADALNPQAANALLKTLEEPGADVMLVLLCEQRSHLLPTVRSRCQMLKLPQPEIAALTRWLQAQAPDEARFGDHDLVQLFSLAYQHSPFNMLEALSSARDEPVLLGLIRMMAGCMSGEQDIFSAAESIGKVPLDELLDLLPWLMSVVYSYKLCSAQPSAADGEAGTVRSSDAETLIELFALSQFAKLKLLADKLTLEAVDEGYRNLLEFRVQSDEGRNPALPLFLESLLMGLREGALRSRQPASSEKPERVAFLDLLMRSQQF